MILPYEKRLKPNARSLRGNMTDAEQTLWQRLRRKQINGWQFYRQKPLGPYIVDFYCAAAHLVIEIDGSQHFEPEHQLADRQRDAYLAELGLRVLRFDNRQVLLETDAVVECISRIPPGPPFSKGGESGADQAILVTDTLSSGVANGSIPVSPPFTKGSEAGAGNESTSVAHPAPHKTRNAPIPPFEKGGLGGIRTNGPDDSEDQP